MRSEKLEDLLQDGISRKFATYYLDLAMKEYDNPAYDRAYVKWAHEQGFLAESAYAYGLDEGNVAHYLSDYDYYKVWPLNNWTRVWINDKLTLKYLLADTLFSDFMPKYYYYTAPEGLRKLTDAPDQDVPASADELRQLLSELGELACKPCNGTTSLGFIRLSCENGVFSANGEQIASDGFDAFLAEHPNYVFTEYLRPSRQFAPYSPHIHTIRLVTINETGSNPRLVGGYFRIPNRFSGEANYIITDGHDQQQCNVFVGLDCQTGQFGPGKLTYTDRAVLSDTHPDNGLSLTGVIENFDELKELALGVARRFGTVEYMGFDIGATDEGFKCMEINSHPGIKYMQIFQPFFDDEYLADYFTRKVAAIDALPQERKQARIGILR